MSNLTPAAEGRTGQSETREPQTKGSRLSVSVLLTIVTGLWFASAIALYLLFSDWNERAQFGDSFGAVNSLFSGLAFAVLIYTMWLQREELQLQRLELQQTREELRRSADAQEAARHALERQIELLTLSTQMAAWLNAQEVWMEKSVREARGMIFERLRSARMDWSDVEVEEATEICRKLDEFAHLVPFLGLEKVLEMFDDPLGKAWVVLEPIVARERERSGGWNRKWHKFEEVGRAALEKLVRENRDPRPGVAHG